MSNSYVRRRATSPLSASALSRLAAQTLDGGFKQLLVRLSRSPLPPEVSCGAVRLHPRFVKLDPRWKQHSIAEQERLACVK